MLGKQEMNALLEYAKQYAKPPYKKWRRRILSDVELSPSQEEKLHRTFTKAVGGDVPVRHRSPPNWLEMLDLKAVEEDPAVQDPIDKVIGAWKRGSPTMTPKRRPTGPERAR